MIYMIETSSYLCKDCEMSFILLPYSFCSSNKRTIILQKEKNMKCILVKQRRSQNMNKRKQEWRVKVKGKNDVKVLSDISTCLIWNLNLRVYPQKLVTFSKFERKDNSFDSYWQPLSIKYVVICETKSKMHRI
jgi:hypothetical protein